MQVRYQLRHRPICDPGKPGATPQAYNIRSDASNTSGCLRVVQAEVFGYPREGWDEPLKSQPLASGLAEGDLSKRAMAQDAGGKQTLASPPYGAGVACSGRSMGTTGQSFHNRSRP